MAVPAPGIFEIVDNDEYGRHRDALLWLTAYYEGPLAVATGYVGLDGLDALAQAGVPAKVVSERLGHASVAFTLDTYAHVLPDQQRQAADLMDSLLPVPRRSAR